MENYELSNKKLIKYIEKKIYPQTLNELGKSNAISLLQRFDYETVISSIDISYNNYIEYKDGIPTVDSTHIFLDKIGGIAYNNSKTPIEKKLIHIKNYCKSQFNYWNNEEANTILKNYINALKKSNWTNDEILNDLENETMEEIKKTRNWSEFKNLFYQWTDSLINKVNISKNNSFINGNILNINKKYNILKEIGSGSFGITYIVHDEFLNKEFVLKNFCCERLSNEENTKFFKKFILEIKTLFDLHHENIVHIYDYIYDESKQTGCYIMEYIEGTNISDYTVNNKSQINNIFLQSLNVFKYLEKKRICHRDIRINNIIISNDGTMKLIDFGFGKEIAKNSSLNTATKLISYPYDYPEEMNSCKQKYDKRTEMYFLGQLFKDILNKNNIRNFKYRKILNKMCQYKYNDRYTNYNEIFKEININT